MIVLNISAVTFIHFLPSTLPNVWLHSLLSKVIFNNALWELSTLSFKTVAVTFCCRGVFFLSALCTDLGNKSLALVAAQGHTMQCDQYYQIVTKTNLESLRLQLPGKVFWIFYEVYLMQSAGLCDNVTTTGRCTVTKYLWFLLKYRALVEYIVL